MQNPEKLRKLCFVFNDICPIGRVQKNAADSAKKSRSGLVAAHRRISGLLMKTRLPVSKKFAPKRHAKSLELVTKDIFHRNSSKLY